MASSYSPNLRIELIGTGDQAGTWGTTTDNTDAYLLESAIAGYQAVPIAPTSNNQVLTYINGASTTASVNQAVYAALKLTASAVSANFNLFAPPASKTYIINNQSGYQATVYNSASIGNTTPAGTGVAIPNGATVAIYSDGTNFFDHSNYAINNFSVGGNALVNGTLTVEGASTFVGIPSGPTAAPGTSTTQLATTAFVQTVAGGLGTMSTQNANNVNISGGTINGVSGTNSGLTVGNAGYATNAGNASTVTNGVYNNGGTYSINVTGSAGYAGTAGNANAVFGKTKLGLGITGETWNYPGRSFNTTYYNPYSYPIAVSASATCAVTSVIYAYVNGNLVSFFQWQYNGCGSFGGAFIIVPPGASYSLNSSQGVYNWTELY